MSELLFNDGEGLDFNDLNNAQRLLRRELYRSYIKPRLIDPGTYVTGDVRPVDAGLQLVIGSGLQVAVSVGGYVAKLAATDPGDPDYQYGLGYKNTQSILTINAADATNPRWDIISVKASQLEDTSETRDFEDGATRVKTSQTFNKRRGPTLDVVYTPGTAAASPAEPSVPSGYTKIARVVVDAGVTSLTYDKIVDYRMPLGRTRHFSWPQDWLLGTNWSRASGTLYATSSGAGPCLIPIPKPRHCTQHARLVGLRLAVGLPASSTVELVHYTQSSASPMTTVIATITGAFTLDGTVRLVDCLAGLATTRPTCWANGECHPAISLRSSDALLYLAIHAAATGARVNALTAEWAGE